MKLIKSLLALFLLTSLVLPSCKDNDATTNSNPCSIDFNQTAMFQNLADNIILPSYHQLNTRLDALVAQTMDFIADPNETQLDALRDSWLAAYLSWQASAQYEFGPAADVFLQNSLNNFPANKDAIEANIASGSYDFDLPDNYDKGFPALDYLLFGLGADDNAILEKFSTAVDAAKYKAYLQAIVEDMQSRVKHTHDTWNSSYRSTFVSNTGTAAGSSLSLIINNLNKNYEAIKREKFGTPIGIVLDIPNPTTIEAYYSKNSVVLAQAALIAAQTFYLGKDGLGLDDNLNAANARKDDQSLDAVIQERFTQAIASLNQLSDPLDQLINDDRATVLNAYNEITKQLVPLKTDMPSALCVSITYIDNPSDTD